MRSPNGLYVGSAYAAIATNGWYAKTYGSRRDDAIWHIRDVRTRDIDHGIDDFGSHRCFLQNVIGIVQSLFQISVSRRGKEVFLDEVDDFSRADNRQQNLSSGVRRGIKCGLCWY